MKPFALFLLLAACQMPIAAQRNISQIKEVNLTLGSSKIVDGVTYSEPDIYYTELSDGTYKATRVTVSPVVTNPAVVTAPYLNQSTDHSIQVCWKTKNRDEGAYVRFAKAGEALTLQTEGVVSQVGNGFFWHVAHLSGLDADAYYDYQVISSGAESEVYRFRTMPKAASSKPFRMLMIGDHQRNERSDYEWLLRMAERKMDEKWGKAPWEDQVRMLLNVGDQVDSGSVRQYEFTHLYKSREVMSRVPIMTCVGNHELKKDPDLLLYKALFSTYGNIDYQGIQSHTANYYAYQAGPVLFVVMNSDGASSEQKQWVRRVVAVADTDPTVKFIVSLQHRPLYAEQWSGDTSPWTLNEVMPILSASAKHVINCSGHHHLYARGQMTPWPVYHMITGGGVGTSAQDYEQLWGNTPDNRNRDEVQKTIDQWTYQLFEFNPDTEEMTVETYSIGNVRLGLDNVMIDRFTRKLSMVDKPSTPQLQIDGGNISLPTTISQQASVEELHSAEYQIARDNQFKDIVFQRVQTFEDFFDVDANFMPKDQNPGKSVTTLELGSQLLPAGQFYIRCRNRSMNLDWSDYSEPMRINVSGAVRASVSLLQHYYQPGQNVEVRFKNAPVGTDAWVGIYVYGKRPGTADLSYAYKYTVDAEGVLSFTVNDPNPYFVVLFGDGGYSEVSDRVNFVVTPHSTDQNPPVLSLDKQVYLEGEPIQVSFSHAPALAKDWVGIYDMGQVPVESKCPTYLYTNGQTDGFAVLNVAGSRNFTSPLPVGDYFACYFMADGYAEATERIPFSIRQNDETLLQAVPWSASTDTDTVSRNRFSNATYLLNGQRVAIPPRGMYILNGKKVIGR